MGYIGNEPTTGHFPVQTNLAGDGSATTFTMDRAPATAGAIEVSIQGVLQPTTAYSISGTTLTLPTAGSAIANGVPIFIRYLGETLILQRDVIANDAIDSQHYADGSIDEAHIANDAVTGAKLNPPLVAGDLIYANNTDVITRLAKGTASQVLTMNAGATAPEWATSIIPYDMAFTAGFDKDMVKEDVAVATYGELVVGRAMTITGEKAYVDTAPTGATLIMDIMKNGTTIYASTKPLFAISANTHTVGVATTTALAAGDRVTFKITQIGSTEPGEGVRFILLGTV